MEILNSYFSDVEWRSYEDSLIVPEPEPLISYILSCHGNQGQYIPERYREFFSYVKKKTGSGDEDHKGCRGIYIKERMFWAGLTF